MSLRIQVVDDSSTIQKVIKIAFSPYQVEVVASGSYIEALTEIQNQTPDLLIVDANISGPKTIADISRLRSEAGNVPVLLLRGSYEGIDEDSLSEAGFTTILRKPFESSDIVNKASSLVELNPNQPKIHQTVPAASPHKTPPPVAPPTPPASFTEPASTSEHEVPLPPPLREGHHSASQPGPGDQRTPNVPPFSLALGQDAPVSEETQTAPPPIPTSNLKGKKAFQTPMEPAIPRPPESGRGQEGPQESVLDDFKGDVADVRMEIARQMREQLPQLVRESVESYCAIHFPKLAREVITTELRRLADEKARHLIDN